MLLNWVIMNVYLSYPSFEKQVSDLLAVWGALSGTCFLRLQFGKNRVRSGRLCQECMGAIKMGLQSKHYRAKREEGG